MDSFEDAVYRHNESKLERHLHIMRRGIERFFLAEEMPGPLGLLKQLETIHGQETTLPPHLFAHFCHQLGLVAGSEEVKLLSRFGELSSRLHIDTGHSAAAAKLYLITSASKEVFDDYEKSAVGYDSEVGDLREGLLYNLKHGRRGDPAHHPASHNL